MKAKRKLKRLLSFLLALLMVVGMLPATSMTASAATLISNFTVQGVTEPKAGSVPVTTGINLGDNVEIAFGLGWYLYDDEKEEFVENGDAPFETGNLYALGMGVKPKDGYAFSDGVEVSYKDSKLINGQSIGNHCFYVFPDGIYAGYMAIYLCFDLKEPTYDISVTDGKATDGKGAEITKAAAGTEVTLTANAAPDGQRFYKWEVVSGSITLAEAKSETTTFTMPASAVSVKATYIADNIIEKVLVAIEEPVAGKHPEDAYAFFALATITQTKWTHNGEILSYEDTFEAGETYIVNARIQLESGYVFADSPFVEINGTEAGKIVDKESDWLEFVAEFTVPTVYTITFDANGGTGTMDDVTGVSGSYTLPENGFNPPEGKLFKGWSTSADGEVITGTTIDVKANTTLYAIWEETVIASVDVKIDEPVIGAYPKDAVSNTDHVKVNETIWSYNGSTLSSSDKFEEGKTYSVLVIAVTDSGYEFAYNPYPTVTFNGSTKGTVSSTNKNLVMYSAEFTAVSATVIDTVDVTVTEPVAGAHPQDAVSNTENVHVVETEWTHNGKNLTASDIFEAGETYEVSVLVEPDNKYAFADDPTITFNGSTTGTIEMNDYNFIYYSAEFIAENAPIDTVDVTLTEPVEGIHPQKAVSNTGNVSVSETEWWHDGVKMSSTDTFEAGKTYKVSVKVISDGSYIFANNPTATFNGTKEGTISANDNDSVCFYAEYTVPIRYVDVEITTPFVGANPKNAVSNSDKFHVSVTSWYCSDPYEPLYATDTFEAGKTYTVEVTVEVESGYIFANNPDITFNGSKTGAVLSKNSEEIRFYAEYTVPLYQIQEIPDLTYTGQAQKPKVHVYNEGVLLKEGKDYTLTYVNNKNANLKVAGSSRMMKVGDGVFASVSDEGFNSDLPYVIIKGKGNYQKEIYVNFNILPSVIGDGSAQEADDVVLKFTDHTEANGKLFKPLTSIKCGKITMKAGVDYEVKVEEAGVPGTNLLNAKGQMEAVEGTYLMTIKGIGNFDGEIVKTIQVAAKTQLLKNAKIKLNIKSKEFDYLDLESDNTTLADSDYTVTIADGKTTKVLVKDTDFTVTYRNNDKVGTATLVLTGKGSYVGSKTITFKITGTALSGKNVDISNVSDQTYTGKAVEQDAKLVLTKADKTKVNLVSGKDYTVTYQNNLKKGTATITFTGNGSAGYTGSLKKTFKINAANLSDDMVSLIGDVPYAKAGATADAKVVLTYNGIKLIKGKDYTLKYTGNKDLGEATVTITGKGNFTGTLTKTFEVVKQNIANTAVTVKPLAYKPTEGYTYKLSVTVKDGKSTLKNGVDYTVEFTSPSKSDLDLWLAGDTTKAPKAVIKAPAESCYTGSVEVPVSIYNVKLSGSNTYVKVDDSTNIYNGAQQLPKTVVYFSTDKAVIKELNTAEKAGTVDTVIADKLAAGKIKVLNAGTDYTVSGVNNIFAGPNKGTVKISGTGMYSGSLSKKFTIQKKDIWWK